MRKTFAGIFLLFGLVSIQAPAQQTFLFSHNGLTRSYTLYLPDQLPDQAPLVFVLHGYYGNSAQIMAYSQMNDQADAHGFAVCYPQGAGDVNGVSHWNAQLGISTIDDVGFLTALAQYLQQAWDLDSDRTFISGHSNGGFMAYTIACEAPGVFKAIASMAGTMSGYTWENRHLATPVPVLQIHGVDDLTVPIDGSMPWPGWGGAPSMDSVMHFWAEVNECSSVQQLFFPMETNAWIWSEGIAGNEVWYYRISNWGHPWPNASNAAHTGTNAAAVIWQFFERISSVNSSSRELTVSSELKIYPNPASEEIMLYRENQDIGEYAVFTLQGLRILSGIVNQAQQSVDISALLPGIYLVQVGSDRQVFIKAN